ISIMGMLAGCAAVETAVTPIPPTTQPTSLPVPTDTPPPPTETAVPQPTATTAPMETAVSQGELSTILIPAPSLAGNLLEDPAERQIAIYLPPSYNQTDKRYPVIYHLAGFDEQLNDSYTLRSLMDAMITDGSVQEMIVVVTSGRNRLGGSFYVNSPVTGNWEDLVVKDLVQYVDENYRTINDPAARGISGFSMGGFGALNLAMRHPEVYGAVYALSPGLFAPDGLANSQMFATPRVGDSFLKWQAELAAMTPEEAHATFLKWSDSSYGDLGFLAAYGAAFASNTDKNAPYIDFPYAESGAQVDEAVWQRWESGFGGITGEVQQYQDNLLSLNGIIIDYGEQDSYFWIPAGADYFSQQLEAANIPHELLTFEGGHGNLVGRAREVMLPFFSNTLISE
ncbi:MAG: alpha/beta hydrolase-fold protein, partial [Chloroflexota bacterium]